MEGLEKGIMKRKIRKLTVSQQPKKFRPHPNYWMVVVYYTKGRCTTFGFNSYSEAVSYVFYETGA